MPSPQEHRLIQLFQSHPVMSFVELTHSLNRSRRSLFRDLSQLDALSSYTHAGQYHTLKSIPQFNAKGLWFFRETGFSQFGTLKATLIQLLHDAEAGYTHKELAKLLRIRVQDSLLDLIQVKKINRELLTVGVYLYVCTEEHKAKHQLARRVAMKEVASIRLPSELIQIDVFAEVIRTQGIDVDSQQLAQKLEAQGVPISDKEIDKIFAFYDIKKNGFRNSSAHPSEN